MSEPRGAEQARTPVNRRSGQAYILFGMSWLLVLSIGSVLQLISLPVGLAITEVALILLPAVLFVRWKQLPVMEALGWRAVPPITVALSIAVGMTAWGVAAGIGELLRPVLGEPPHISALEPRTLSQLLVILVCGAFLAGICEETLFRGAIQGLLGRKGTRQAVLITAFLFAIYHANPWVFLPALFLGVVFGTLVIRTGSTVPAVLAHMANNTMAFSVSYLYHDRPDSAAHVLMTLAAVAFCATFPIFWARTRRAEPPEPLLATVPAGVSRPVVWVAGFVGGTVVLLVISGIIVAVALVDIYPMPSDALEPHVRQGERLVVLKGDSLDFGPGDIVAYHRDGETVLRRISRIEGDRIWISEGASERELARQEITGKVVYIIKNGKSPEQE